MEITADEPKYEIGQVFSHGMDTGSIIDVLWSTEKGTWVYKIRLDGRYTDKNTVYLVQCDLSFLTGRCGARIYPQEEQ